MPGLSFLKKKSGRGQIPIERVKELFSHGFSEAETIDILRKEGYSPEEIDKALTEVIRSKIEEEKSEKKEEKKETKIPKVEDILSQPQEPQTIDTDELTSQYYQYSLDDYVNYIDSIVESRVSEISEKISEISSKYAALEKKIAALDQALKELTRTRYSEQKALLDKIDSFRDSLEDINVRVGGLEKAFKETLPALIESVRALSDLVQRMKREI
jgi:chromosome segregation ATPase